ncbi:hypothetical protein HRR78_001407 [Exophiala dermatitidis]|nr:hypothetical protein HRR78_001407 [Exophiala dermatitidis]
MKTDSSYLRYAGMLLQHHAAVTAGLIELYQRLLKGQPWEGSPVDELNGTPSVHCILERLGVIDAEDEVDPTPNPTLQSDAPVSHVHSTAASAAAIGGRVAKSRKPSTKFTPSRKGSQAASAAAREFDTDPLLSPLSTSTTIVPPAGSSFFETTEDPALATGYFNQVASPLSCASRSGSLQSTTTSSSSTWDSSQSPDISDDMFTTPIPTPTTTTNNDSQCQSDFLSQTQQQQQFPDGSFPVYTDDHQTPVQVSYTSAEVQETCTAGYFLDATGGMGLYGWDASNMGSNVPFGTVPPDCCNPWDSGVLIEEGVLNVDWHSKTPGELAERGQSEQPAGYPNTIKAAAAIRW